MQFNALDRDMIKLTNHPLFEKLRASVTFVDPSSVYISPVNDEDEELIHIGAGLIIYPNVYLIGSITIGNDCVIGHTTTLINVTIGNNCTIESSKIYDTTIGNNVSIGPFALIENSSVGDKSILGFTAQVKRSQMGSGTIAKHHCYVGDARIGNNVNLSAGSITGNYNGMKKHVTIIEDGVMIGINANLIAPVTISRESYIAANAIVKKDVPPHAVVVGLDRVLSNKKSYRLPEGWELREVT